MLLDASEARRAQSHFSTLIHTPSSAPASTRHRKPPKTSATKSRPATSLGATANAQPESDDSDLDNDVSLPRNKNPLAESLTAFDIPLPTHLAMPACSTLAKDSNEGEGVASLVASLQQIFLDASDIHKAMSFRCAIFLVLLNIHVCVLKSITIGCVSYSFTF